MKKIICFAGLAVVLAACTPVYETMTRSEAINFCQDEAREASTVTSGEASVGVNSNSGPSFGLGIGINLTPRPYGRTFDQCMSNLAANNQIIEGN